MGSVPRWKIYVDKDTYHFIRHRDMAAALWDYIRRSRIFFPDLKETIRREKWKIEKLHMMFSDTENRDEKLLFLREKFPELSVSCATSFIWKLCPRKQEKETVSWSWESFWEFPGNRSWPAGTRPMIGIC